MRLEGYLMKRGIVILVFLLGCICTAAFADQVPDMTGSWSAISVNEYSPSGGYANVTAIQEYKANYSQENRNFFGDESYRETAGGADIIEPIAGVLSSDGKKFWRDHDGSGISFGEMLSDHEYMDYMLLPDDGPLVIAARMVKAGTEPSTSIPAPLNLTGTWNFTSQRRNENTTFDGTFTVNDQEGRIFTGVVRIPEENGSVMQLGVMGVVGTGGELYAVADNHAIYVGRVTGENTMHYVVVHPQDEDKTFVVDHTLTRDMETAKVPEVSYPDISGTWNITNRTIIQNGTITYTGPIDTEWMVYSNLTGPYFTATRYSDDPVTPPVIEIAGVFNEGKEAFLASGAPTYVIYHFPDENKIEAIVMRKEGDSALYLDSLVRNKTS